jgi:hypothetical protein
MEKGFKQSRLFLNKALHNLEYWNEKEIINRANYLKDRALKIWTFPSSEYQSEEDNLKIFTLNDDDVSFTGEKILSYQFMKKKEKTIQSWKNFYKIILLELYDFDPIKFEQIVNNNNFKYKKSSATDINKHFKINNFYIYSILDTETILSRLRILIEEIGLDLNDLSFTIL